MIKKEYISQIKLMLLENVDSQTDISPNGMSSIIEVSEHYRNKISDNVIESVLDTAKWIETYLMHCRHMARPIDKILVTNLINLISS